MIFGYMYKNGRKIPVAWDTDIEISKILSDEKNIEIKDPVFEKMVRDILKKPFGGITESDVKSIKKLDISGVGIETVQGIEHFTELEELYIWTIPLKSLKFLENLRKLKVLDMANCNLHYIYKDDFKNNTELEVLMLNDNKICGVEQGAFDSLKALKVLDLEECMVEDLNFLKNINLKELYISSNRLSDISGLVGHSRLEVFWASKNYIGDLKSLKDLKNLHWLKIDNNNVKCIDSLSELTGLKRIDISDNGITDIYALKDAKNLEWLLAGNNNIVNIDVLSDKYNLKHLVLKNNRIHDVSPILSIPDIKLLWLGGNYIYNSDDLVVFSDNVNKDF